jgi:chitin disaccharide deacetylase
MIKKLIVNADDYGHTRGASEGIRQAHLHGIVTSTTVMMNRPPAVEDLKKANDMCPNLGVGVHLILTTGKPLLPAKKVSTLIQPDGNFLKRDGFIRNIENISVEQARAEWDAQVSLFVKTTGRQPDHLDSHHHASYFTPALFEEMLLLAEEIGCPIRLPFNKTEPVVLDYLPDKLAKKDNEDFLVLLEKYSPDHPDRFLSNFYGESATCQTLLDNFRSIMDSETDTTFEIMCHPAIVDEDLKQASEYKDQRANELQALIDPSLLNELEDCKIKLVNFGDL